MLENCRFAITTARMLESGTDPALPPAQRSLRGPSRIDFRDAFYIATAGGGEALDLPVGCFDAGMEFDAVLIDANAPGGTLRLHAADDAGEAILQKIIHTANERNIVAVWVAGRLVKPAS